MCIAAWLSGILIATHANTAKKPSRQSLVHRGRQCATMVQPSPVKASAVTEPIVQPPSCAALASRIAAMNEGARNGTASAQPQKPIAAISSRLLNQVSRRSTNRRHTAAITTITGPKALASADAPMQAAAAA